MSCILQPFASYDVEKESILATIIFELEGIGEFVFLSIRLVSVLRDHSVFSSPPQRPMTSHFERFPSQILSITFVVLCFILQKEPVSPFFNVECQTRELLVPFL